MNTIAATSYVNAVDEEPSKAASQATQSASSDTVVPGQPLPGSSVSLSGLWRLVEDQMKEVANAVSGTGRKTRKPKSHSLKCKNNRKSVNLRSAKTTSMSNKSSEKERFLG